MQHVIPAWPTFVGIRAESPVVCIAALAHADLVPLQKRGRVVHTRQQHAQGMGKHEKCMGKASAYAGMRWAEQVPYLQHEGIRHVPAGGEHRVGQHVPWPQHPGWPTGV